MTQAVYLMHLPVGEYTQRLPVHVRTTFRTLKMVFRMCGDGSYAHPLDVLKRRIRRSLVACACTNRRQG